MPARTLRIVACVPLFLAFGCGSSSGDDGDTLPQAPQLLINPRPVLFGLVAEGAEAQVDLVMLNGGLDDLTISALDLTDDTGAFSVANVMPSNKTAESTASVVASLAFNPPSRGVYEAELVVKSNAENEANAPVPLFGAAGSDPLSEAPDVLAFETTAHLVPDLNLAFVRFVNVGRRAAALAAYELDSSDGAFGLASGVAEPSIAEPIPLSRGAFVIVAIAYTGTGGGPHQATFTLTHYDYDDITYPGGVRTVDPGVLVTTVVNITSEPE